MIAIQGKYTSASSYYLARGRRALLRSVIRHLVSWQPLEEPIEGYTVIVGCPHRLSPMLAGNLRMLARQDLSGLAEVLVVIDTTRGGIADDVEPSLRRRFSNLPLRFLYYTPHQARVTGMVRWAWVYSWLSWCIGIAATRTRYALLHDFDAMLLRQDILRERHERMAESPLEYLGVRYYECNGVLPSDRLVTTFEMMFNAAFVRRVFRPLDLFNHVCRYKGRTVDFDTFLHAQARMGAAAVVGLEPEEMVHPSQMICQFTEFMNGRELNAACSSLLLIPYYLRVGSDGDATMRRIEEQLTQNGSATIEFFGRNLDVGRLELTHARWLRALATRLEKTLFGEMRSDVRSYFDAICSRAQAQETPLAREKSTAT